MRKTLCCFVLACVFPTSAFADWIQYCGGDGGWLPHYYDDSTISNENGIVMVNIKHASYLASFSSVMQFNCKSKKITSIDEIMYENSGHVSLPRTGVQYTIKDSTPEAYLQSMICKEIGIKIVPNPNDTSHLADKPSNVAADLSVSKKKPKLSKRLREAIERRKEAEKDDTDDIVKLKERANGGHAAAQVKLGAYYADNKDYKNAIIWYRKAANNGNSSGMYNVAALYDRGIGVNQNSKAAFDYYKKAADIGNLNAMTRLGEIYYQGVGGVSVDKQMAIRYWQRASDDNFIPAMSRMCQYAPGYMIEGQLRMYCSGE